MLLSRVRGRFGRWALLGRGAGGVGPDMADGLAQRGATGTAWVAPRRGVLVAGPAGKDAAVRKAARAGDGVIRAVQPGQALAVGGGGRERCGAA